MRKYFLGIGLLPLFWALTIKGQVTIGSDITPAEGALLDLKQHNPDANNATSNSGMMLPRVELNNAQELSFGSFLINNNDNDGNQKLKHTGLTVFNVTTDAPFCKGIYVWDGETWQSILPCDNNESNIVVNTTGPFYAVSGQDAQTITKIPLTLSWGSDASKISTDNIANNPLYGKVEFVTIDPSAFTNYEGTNISLQPQPMTFAEVNIPATGGNPFKTKMSGYYFVETKANGKQYKTNPIVVYQTNKALLLDNKYDSPLISLLGTTTTATNKQHTITSNAKWVVKEIYPATNSAFTNVKVNNATVSSFPTNATGEEKYDNTAATAATLSYTANQNASLASYSRLVLADANPIPRFYDIVVSVYQCGTVKTAKQPTMPEWAAIAGFRGVLDKKEWKALSTTARSEADKKARIDTSDATSGIAWHRDQDGNIFLSGSFVKASPTSNARRWMITNLAATTYDPSRSDGTIATSAPNWGYSASATTPYIGYPNGGDIGSKNSTTYDSNPRIGLLYNWTAATMGKTATTKVQGICPKGWHLPSDTEMTNLEQEISSYTATYSSQKNLGIDVSGYASYRGMHAAAMKDPCQNFSTTVPGTSNSISYGLRSGFNAFNAGYAQGSSSIAYNLYAYFWTSTSVDTTDARARFIVVNQEYVQYSSAPKSVLASIRCVMD